LFIHKFISIPFTFDYLFGEKSIWYAGVNFHLGLLLYLHQKIVYSEYQWHYDNNYTQYKPVFLLGAIIGRKIIATKKINAIINYSINYSSIISGSFQSNNNSNSIINSFQTKPRALFYNSLNINLQYKL
jgi:hypothetical protein